MKDLNEFIGYALNTYKFLIVYIPESFLENHENRELLNQFQSRYRINRENQAIFFQFQEKNYSIIDVLYSATTLSNKVIAFSEESRPWIELTENFGDQYVILATPRSGSDMLCSMVAKSGGAGRPREYLNKVALRLIRGHGVSLAGWLSDLARNSQERFGRNYGLKLATDDISAAMRDATLPDAAALFGYIASGRIIALTRTDKRGQALSIFASRRTRIFNRNSALSEEERRRIAEARAAATSDQIDRIVAEIEEWERRFIEPFDDISVTLTYEELTGPDRRERLRRAYDVIGVDRPDFEPTTVRISA